ncbi:hypothetical protein BKA57DRAFT_301964 [Linnemannia elongata]|nr:hypothetical protein BKA57DRAFT_301964 [Linnemannia elongata]
MRHCYPLVMLLHSIAFVSHKPREVGADGYSYNTTTYAQKAQRWNSTIERVNQSCEGIKEDQEIPFSLMQLSSDLQKFYASNVLRKLTFYF